MGIGSKIRNRRIELQLTLEDVAKAMGVSKSTVSRYESDEIENMGIDKVEALAKILQVSTAYIMGWSDKPEPKTETEAHYMLDKEIYEALELLKQIPKEDLPLASEMLKRLARRG